MKKVIAVLLTVLMTFSVMTVGVAAADSSTGTVYQYTSAGIPRVKSQSPEEEVTILQGGDIIRFEEVKSAGKRLEVRYYPDAAGIKAKDINNKDWKDVKVPLYNLDSSKWELDKESGQKIDDLMAKSPNYYKSFYNAVDIAQGEMAEITIIGLNAEPANAKDGGGIDRGVAPIDYTLEGARFVGWVLFNYSKWKNNNKDDVVIELYALWERGAAPESPDQNETDDADEAKNPIQRAYDKVMAFLTKVATWIGMVPSALSTVIPNYLNGLIRDWLYYGLFDGEV